MTFKADLAEDLRQVLNAEQFDEAATYYPKGSATGFAVRVVRGDITTGSAGFDQGTEQTRSCEAVLIRSVVRAGIETLDGAERDPRKGDKLVFTEDDDPTAEWFVQGPGATDAGGGVTVQLVSDTFGNPAGRGAVESR